MIFRLVRGIILILIGPLATLLLVISLQVSEPKVSYSFISKAILILGVITILISLIGHILLKVFSRGMIVTVTISEAIYLLAFSFYALSDPVNWQENLMWLPIATISATAISLPMSISISYGTGSIVNTVRKLRQESKGMSPQP